MAPSLTQELRGHFESAVLTDAQKVLLFLLATDRSRRNAIVQISQSDLATMTGSTRETVRNRIVAMPELVTKNTYQIKTDLRLCTYKLHLTKAGVADSAVTLTEPTGADNATDAAVIRENVVADAAVISLETSSTITNTITKTNREDNSESDLKKAISGCDWLEEKDSNTKMTAKSATVSNGQAT